MDRFFYSKYTKVAAAIIAAVLTAVAAMTAFDTLEYLERLEERGELIYHFEKDYQSSDYYKNGSLEENEYYNKTNWENQAEYVKMAFYKLMFFELLSIALFVYLAAVCGRKNYESAVVLMRIDSVWSEILILLIGISIFLSCFALAALFGKYLCSELPAYFARSFVMLVCFTEKIFLEISALSVIRSVKAKSFLRRSVILRCILFLFQIFKRVLHQISVEFTNIKKVFSDKTGMILSFILLFYTAFIGACGVRLNRGVSALFVAFIAYAAGCAFLGTRAKDLENIITGVAAIKEGDVSYRLENIRCEDYQRLAQDINDIGEGISAAVEEKIRSERMKTELITNVSHDLKTPLTSIINYSKLLVDMELSPQEAADYAAIISKNSERLKKLTADLFEISRVQSGDETFIKEKLDTTLLIQQSLGEYDSEIQASGLIFCVDLTEELFIEADGKKMSRVVGNLLENILKYAMPKTRVFVSSHKAEGKAVIELKNISAYPLDFSAEEITERFVRGDKSRSEEGNGLGLAIAKGYTEACGGDLHIVTDGDMFKAVLKFDAKE